MRNLKRALSLALASVMLLGMMVVGASAASYTDVDDKDNVEAIEVLNAVEVMIGRQGNFEPDEAVNRHEMAVIMAKLYLGVEAADNYVGSHPFTDVVSWADKYVAACYENGLVAGTSATTFSGSNPLTAVEAAAMMLRALGYENLSKGAANWSTPVTAKANEIRLFAGVASSPKEKLTRNQVAQLALNTLQSTMVTAKGGNDIQIGDVIIPDEMEYTFRVAEKASVGTAIDTKYQIATSAGGATSYTLELGEHLYNGNLRKAETTDDFGRPATRWTYKTNEIGVYVDTSSVYKSWTAKVAKNELYDLLGGGNVGKLSLVSAIDGTKSNQLVVYVDGVAKTDKGVKEYIDRDNTGASGGCAGKGVLTEVFQDSNNNVTLSFTNTYLMQATADYNETSKSVRVTVLTSPKNQTVSVNVLKSEDFDGLEGIKEDDYILYTYAKGDIQSGQVATVATGEVTAFSVATGKTFGEAGGSVTLDSTKRDYAKYAEVDATNGCAVEYKLGASASIVLDAYGYVIYVDDSSLSVGNYVYVNAVAPQTGLKSKFLADAIFTDGTRDSIVVKSIKGRVSDGGALTGELANSTDIPGLIKAADSYGGTNHGTVGGWYAYSKNSSGEYTLVKAATSTVFANNSVKSGSSWTKLKIDNNKIMIGSTAADGTAPAVTGVAGDKNTIFVVLGSSNKVTVYTGIANVPDVTGATAASSFYLRSKDDGNKNASAVFIDATSGSVRNGNSDLLYLLNLDGSEKNTGNVTEDTVYTWNVVMVKDGVVEQTKIKTTDGTWTGQNIYKSYGIDTNDFYDLDNTTDKLTLTYPAGDDVKVDITTADEINCDGETFTWDDNSLIVNADSAKGTALVVYPGPRTDAASNKLREEVNMDEDATYKVYTGWSGKQIANLFRDWNATGSVYAVLDAKTDRVKSMIVVVNGISGTSGSSSGTKIPGSDLIVLDGAKLPGNADATDINDAFKNYDVIQIGAAADGVYSVPTSAGINIPNGKTIYFPGGVKATSSNKIKFYSGSKLISGGDTELDQVIDSTANIETASLTLKSAANKIAGNVTVTGATTFGANTEVTGTLTTNSVTASSATTVTVKGDMTVKGEKVQNGQAINNVNFVVLSDNSLHFTCDVPSSVVIVVGDGANKTSNGRVTITGKLEGTVIVQNKDSAKTDVELKDVAATAQLVVKTASSSIAVSGEMGTKKIAVAVGGSIDIADASKVVSGLFKNEAGESLAMTGSVSIAPETAEEKVGAPENVTVDTTNPAEPSIGEADPVAPKGDVTAVTTSKITLSPRIIMNETDYRNAITAGVRLTQNVTEWSALDSHGVATFPWLNVGVKLKDGETLTANDKITLTITDENNTVIKTKKGSSTTEGYEITVQSNGNLTGAANTHNDVYAHWEMLEGIDQNVNYLVTNSTADTAKHKMESTNYMMKDHTFTIKATITRGSGETAKTLTPPEDVTVEYKAPTIVAQPTDVTYQATLAQGVTAKPLPTGVQAFTVNGNVVTVTKSYTMNQKVTNNGTETDSENDCDDYTFAGLKICAESGGWFKPADGYKNFVIVELVPVAGAVDKFTQIKVVSPGAENGNIGGFDTPRKGCYLIFAWNENSSSAPVTVSWAGSDNSFGTGWTIDLKY